MAFRCFLDCSAFKSPPAVKLAELGNDLDSYEVRVMAACEMLDETGVRFQMSGFGSDDWRLDVEYDLSIFMEDLPEILDALSRKQEYEFFFSSQGVQRTLTFVPADENIRIHCFSMTSWVPSPAVEEMARIDLVEMLKRLAVDFGVALMRLSSPLSGEEPFRSWAEGRVQSAAN